MGLALHRRRKLVTVALTHVRNIKLKKIYYDGDSFSILTGPDSVENNTGNFLSTYFNFDLKHYGFPGKNPEAVIRSAMRYVFAEQDKDTFMCIGVGVADRLDGHVDNRPYHNISRLDYWPEESGTGTLSIGHKALEADKKVILGLTQQDYVRTKLLLNLILLHDFLLQNNIKFIIHNLGINYQLDKDYIFQKGLPEQLESRPRIVNFLKNSLHDLMYEKNIKGWDHDRHGVMSHPGPDGHKMYAEFLIPYIEKYNQ